MLTKGHMSGSIGADGLGSAFVLLPTLGPFDRGLP